ncbi:MAG: ANTAR domain-containing protein [Mycobacterium sp.]|uniref:ANTAR domain-containing protein n=1 Tax=Mycobacterium sp. TaxID=1785 RepID=UPI001EC4B072|nr:ANTAR domain-containing protein [Mycobacterium sp.]MBV8785981.1 ANTAR domain-containing protein [Mycobacterium sp.]
MFLDRDLRIRGLNGTYEAISMRRREEMLGEFVFDVFPDNPDDPKASGCSRVAESAESAMRKRGTDAMPIVRYDIADPQNPEIFMPKLWTCSNTAVDDGHDHIGVLHQVAEIVSLDEALSALSRANARGELAGAGEQLHVLAALAARVRADQGHVAALTQEIEQLRRAVESRDVIGQAKGILMERFDINAAAAFALLVRLSQRSNTPVTVIAQKLIEIDHPSA